MTMRGIKKPGSKTVTTVTRGEFKENMELQKQFLAMGQGLMDRVNQIWNHPLYQNELNKLQLLETDREFCRHTPEHFLDVARLAYIRALEENAPVSKELIYCTALLHDIGRARQYEDGTPHDEAGAAIAGQILNELGFSMEEVEAIIAAIPVSYTHLTLPTIA